MIDCARTSHYTEKCVDAWSAGVLNPSGIVLRDPLAACSHPMCLREGRGTPCKAPPAELAELVAALAYKPGWRFHLADIDRGQGSEGLTLDIVTLGYNSYHPEQGENYRVHHFMPVPPAAFDRRSWQRWLLEQILLVERHEACEFFRFEPEHGQYHQKSTERPYAPSHGPGNDPYLIREVGTDLDQRTSFRGEVNA